MVSVYQSLSYLNITIVTNFVARIGGEEFTITLGETNLEGAAVQAEWFREEIESFDWPRHTITVSIGVAQVSERISDSDELFRVADEALYSAKKQGRNQIAIATNDVCNHQTGRHWAAELFRPVNILIYDAFILFK